MAELKRPSASSRKQLDYAVAACASRGFHLKLVGDGPEYKSLRVLAGPTVEFWDRVSDTELRELYARCRAFLVPGEEDFGMPLLKRSPVASRWWS